MTKLSTLKWVTVAMIVVVSAATAAEAKASGTTGTVVGQPAICSTRPELRITVYPPSIYAVPVRQDGIVVFGPTHYQWVAYQASVYRVVNGRLYYVARGPWKKTLVTDDVWYTHPSWTNLSTGRVEYGRGQTVFRIPRRGAYVVRNDVYWYPDQYVGAGRLLVGPSQYITTWDWKNKPNCPFGVF
jgi:hypothetical protein